jgi:hypothetical protein
MVRGSWVLCGLLFGLLFGQKKTAHLGGRLGAHAAIAACATE